jgi:RNA polymerase sigma factor (sigma-70 family)
MTLALRSASIRDWSAVGRFAGHGGEMRKGRCDVAVDWNAEIGKIASAADRYAFKVVFEHFAPRIKGFMLRTGATPSEAEEIAQNTLLAVWRKATSFDPATSGAGAWIFTIARNLRIDAARRAARDQRVGMEVESSYWPDPVEPPDMTIARDQDALLIRSALERLPREQSDMVRLAFIEERSHSEIAHLLDVPLGTVKSRIRLAMKRLKEILDEAI